MQTKFILCLLAVLIFLPPFKLFSEPVAKAIFVDTAPRLDGTLNDEAWQKAAVIDVFYQREPNTAQPVTERTEFYICYDQDYLYFGVKCYDDPNAITAKELARDVSLRNDDRIQIILDTFLDRRNAYWFQIGPRGSIGDALISQNGAAFNKQWDGLWQGKARIHDQGWDAELAIPFKTLSFRTGQSTWGLKLIRHIKRNLESAYWPTANLDTYRFQVSDAGILEGLQGIRQGHGLDISPYGLVGLDQEIGHDMEFPGDIGLDVFYQITSGLKSALTLNTDFAQTEVDARQINLTRFQLHFPEKRDFFLDGANYFQFGREGERDNPFAQRVIAFFSRRIGLDEDGNPIPLLWGGKLTGQQGQWNLGLLTATDERDSGNQNFIVSRISRNFGTQSSIGFIATHGNALSDTANHLLGADIKLASSTFQGNKNIALTLFGLRSSTEGLIDHDWAFGGEVSYPNDFLSLRLGFHQIEKNFRAGVGFVPRLDIRETYFESALGPRPNRWGILQMLFEASADFVTNLDNQLLTRKIRLTPLSLRFISGDEIEFSLSPQHEYLSEDFNVFEEQAIPQGSYDFWRYEIELSSAQRRNFWASTKYEWGSFFNGDRKDVTVAFGYKVSVPFFVGLEFERNNVSLTDGRFTTNIVRANVDILLSPDITFNNFIQYDNESKSMGWQSRFRWIIKPGNEILLVWNSLWQDPLEYHQVTQSATRLKIRYNYRF